MEDVFGPESQVVRHEMVGTSAAISTLELSSAHPVVEAPSSWFLQNPHLPPGSVVLVAAADADWNPRPLHERFDTSDGRLVPATGGLGDLYVLARVWPSAVLKRKDLYLRGRTSDMLGRLDEKRVLLIAPGEGRGKTSHRRDARSNADGDGAEAEAEDGGEERDGYADAVDVRIVMLEASGGDEERDAASTLNKQATASTTTPSRGGTGAKFVAMSPSMRQSVGQEPSPLFLNSVDRGSGGGREGGRSSERKKKKGKNREEQEPAAAVPSAAYGGASSSSPLPSVPPMPSMPSVPSSAVEDALAKHGSRTNAVLQALFRSALRDTWLLQGSMCPIPFLDSRLGAVVTSKEKGCRPFRIGRATRIVLRVGGGRGDDGASAGATSSNDINYADAAVASLREDGSGVEVDASIVSSVHKAATAGYLSLRSLRLEPATRASELLKMWITYPLQNYEVFRDQGTLPPTGVLLHGPPGTGKTLLARWVARDAGAKLFIINGSEIMSEFLGDSERCLSAVFAAARALSPSIIFIDEIDVLGPSRSDVNLSKTASRLVATLAGELDGIQGHPVMVVGATNRKEALDESLRRPRRLEKELEIGVPDPEERLHILEALLSHVSRDADVKGEALKALALRAHGYVGADLLSVVSEACMIALRRHVSGVTRDANVPSDSNESIEVTMDDLNRALYHTKPSALREFASDIPDVTLDDVGGNDELKQRLLESVEWPIKFKRRLDEMGAVAPKGILLCGPPGCSKTLLVKAIAGVCRLNFFSVKGPELMSKYVGESERALANLFDKARKASPSILFFDEIDGLVGARSATGASSGGVDVGERVLSQMLQEMDGVKGKDDQVIVIGATNRMDKLDKALLRPGRFDRVLQVNLPLPADRREILRIHTRRVPIDCTVVLDDLVALTDGFSGAELAGLVQRAAMHALCDDASAVRASDFLAVL